MAKWVFTRAGTWDYPTLGFTATTDDIIEADLAPDAWWDETDSGATPTIPVVPSGGVEEPEGDSLLVYNAVTNRGEWTPLTDLGLDDATLSSTFARYVQLTQAEYDALGEVDPTTFYWITDGVDSAADLTALAAALAGGTAGQVPVKASGVDWDIAWGSAGGDATEAIFTWTRDDFIGGTSPAGTFSGAAIATGTVNAPAAEAGHPGLFRCTSHASNANSGYRIGSQSNAVLLGGGEKVVAAFKTAPDLTGVTLRIGFLDTITEAAPADSVCVSIVADALTGGTSNNSTPSTTDTGYTVTAATWYRVVIELNADATLATFTLYADDSATVLWTDTLDANIPTAAGRQVGVMLNATLASPSGATELAHLDFLAAYLPQRRLI